MKSKEIIIGNNKIRYTQKEQKNDDVVYVFLHGWGSDHTALAPLYETVNTMVAFDFPGFGGSSEPKEAWSLEEYANNTKEFLKKRVGEKKMVFVAHSFGGRVLLKMLNQGGVKNIQHIIGIGIPFTRRYSGENRVIRDCIRIAKSVLSVLSPKTKRKIQKKWCEIIDAKDYANLNSEVMKKTFRLVINEDMQKLSEILREHKVDMIWGDCDSQTPLSDAVMLTAESGAALHILKDADHFPFIGKTKEQCITLFKKIIKT